MVAVQAHYRAAPGGTKPADMSAVTLLTGDPNAVAKTAPATPAPLADPVVGVDPGLGISVTKSGKSLDAHGRRSPTIEATKVLDNLAVPIVGGPFSQTNLGRALIHGDFGGFHDALAPPNGGAGMVNAGMAPFPIKGGGALGRVFGRGIPSAATDAEAAAKVAEATTVARGRGYGRAGAPEVPPLKPGEVTPETGGHAGSEVRQALGGAPAARAVQKGLYRAERAKRFSKADEALQGSDPNVAFPQALGHFKGELPKVNYQGFREFNADTLHAIGTHLKDTETLSTPQKVAAWQSIQKAIAGKVPTASEQRLLERAFGRETSDSIAKSAPIWKKIGRGAAEILNIPRAFQSAFDLSAPFRQGLVAAAAHPRIFASEFGPMLKAAASEPYFQTLQQSIHQMPTYPLMEQAKLSLTDIGKYGNNVPLADREEQFMSNLADKIPVLGHGVRFSERAYVGFLNKLRADLFNDAVHRMAQSGVDVTDPKELESIGKVVNVFTGRGDIGKLQGAAPLLNSVFFSPRLLASRLNLIFGVGEHGIPGEYYMSLSPFARREALLGMRNLLGGLSTALLLAKLSGASVGSDPTNADFAKIKLGNTRFDLSGGFQQPVRLMAQLLTGRITSSTTGKQMSLTQQGYGKMSRKDIIQRFIEGKYAPVPSAINDVLSNKNFQGQPLTLKSEAYSHLVPLLAQDIADLERQYGPLAAAGGLFPAGLGIGLQTYGQKKTGLTGPSSPPAHSDHMFSAPPGIGRQSPISHSSGMFSAPPGKR